MHPVLRECLEAGESALLNPQFLAMAEAQRKRRAERLSQRSQAK
jgi:hypothetical protein